MRNILVSARVCFWVNRGFHCFGRCLLALVSAVFYTYTQHASITACDQMQNRKSLSKINKRRLPELHQCLLILFLSFFRVLYFEIQKSYYSHFHSNYLTSRLDNARLSVRCGSRLRALITPGIATAVEPKSPSASKSKDLSKHCCILASACTSSCSTYNRLLHKFYFFL